MAGLFGVATKAKTHPTKAMGIDFQGAQYGPVIPVVYGQNRVAGNCIWYGDFNAQAQQQKAGKGGGGSTTSYTYSASAQMAVCEGPGIGLVTVWDGNSTVSLGSINYAFAGGAKGQAPWSHLSGQSALGYTYTAIFSFQNLALGGSASLPNYNYEVIGLKPHSSTITDASPADVLTDICSDPVHGIAFPWLGSLTQYSDYCVASGLFLSPVYDQQETANQALSDLFKYTNTYAYYSEDQLKVVPLGDVAVTGNGVTFTPNVTPIVNLGSNDFLVDGSGAAITIDRKAPQDNLNLVRVEFKDRANTYHDSAAVASIDEDIIAHGGRSDDSETVNGCTTAAVARFIAQNLVQRAFYIRNTYTFKLSWRYCYLEPTDIVTLTDASLGLNEFPVRITDVEEDGDSAITITAEEFPEGIGHSALYNTQPNGGTNVDPSTDPGAVNAPFLFRGPGFLVGNNAPEIWCAVNGSEPLWGGCDVYLSHDGNSYTFAGTVAAQARYGSLTSALPKSSADPDTIDAPTVKVYAPAQLLGGSQTDADNFVTLAMIDTEIIAYETATLTAANTYKLGYLRRGGYGSGNVAHASGAPFVRLDDAIFRLPVDASLIGQTVYLKFLSLNVFGKTPRTLAKETAYTYVVGTNVELPDVPDIPGNFTVAPIADGVNITWTNDNPAATGCTSLEYATASGGPFTVLAQEGPTTTSYQHHFANGATYYYRARARGPLPQSGWSAYTAEISSTGKTVEDGAMNLANHTQDDLADGSKYARTLGAALQSGLPIGATLGGSNLAPNPSFESNQIGATIPSSYTVAKVLCDDWSTGELAGFSVGIQQNASRVRSGTNSLHVSLLSGTSVANNAFLAAGAWTRGNFSCVTGDTFYVGGYMFHDASVQEPARVVITANVVLRFYDSTGKYLSQEGAEWTQPSGGSMSTPVGATVVAPANAATYKVYCLGILTNTSGAAITTNSAWAGLWFDDVFAYRVSNLDNEVADGSTYQRMPAANMDVNRRGLIDFTQSGHLGKSLANIPDDAGSSRYAVADIDANRRALIDFAQSGHANKTLDNMPDGTGRAALAAVGVTNGHVTRLGTPIGIAAGRNLLFNPTGALGMQGWSTFVEAGSNVSFGSSTFSGGRFFISIANTAGSGGEIYQPLNSIATQVAASYRVTADIEIDDLTLGSGYGIGIDVFDATAGTALGQQFVTTSQTISFQTTAPTAAGHNISIRMRAGATNVSAFFYRLKLEMGSAPTAYSDDYGNALVTQTHNPTPATGLDGILDGPGYWRLSNQDQVQSGGVNRLGLRIAGSGQRIGDQRNLASSISRNYGIVRSATALTAHSTGAVDVNAHTIQLGDAAIGYNAVTSAVSGLTVGQTAYVYTNDNYAGGTQTWLSTLSAQTANSSDLAYLAGVVTIPASGSAGGGAAGGCICADAYLREGLTARMLAEGWRWWKPWLWFLEGHDGWHMIRRRPRIVKEPWVHVIVADGSTLDCSTSTPVTTRSGESVLAPMLYGRVVWTDSGWQKVIECELGQARRDVVRISVGGHSFLSGNNPYHRIETHNEIKP